MSDCYLEFTYRCSTDAFETLESNIKPERIVEVLEDWLRTQIGAGPDFSVPATSDVYTVRIELDLTDDSFVTKANTGNKSLTCGLVLGLFRLRRETAQGPTLEDRERQ